MADASESDDEVDLRTLSRFNSVSSTVHNALVRRSHCLDSTAAAQWIGEPLVAVPASMKTMVHFQAFLGCHLQIPASSVCMPKVAQVIKTTVV